MMTSSVKRPFQNDHGAFWGMPYNGIFLGWGDLTLAISKALYPHARFESSLVLHVTAYSNSYCQLFRRGPRIQ